MSIDEKEERELPADIVTANKLAKEIDGAIDEARKLLPIERAQVLATLATALARVQKGLLYRRRGSALMTKTMSYSRSR